MEDSAHPKSTKAKTRPRGGLILLLVLLKLKMIPGDNSPHQVFNITWRVTNLMTGVTANSKSMLGTLTYTFPPLYFDLCDLVGSSWDPSDQEPFPGYGCHHPGGRHGTRTKGFYVCPGQGKQSNCGGPGDGYCAQWGCETTGDVPWKPHSSWDLITLT